jgi:hypothetical protein
MPIEQMNFDSQVHEGIPSVIPLWIMRTGKVQCVTHTMHTEVQRLHFLCFFFFLYSFCYVVLFISFFVYYLLLIILLLAGDL